MKSKIIIILLLSATFISCGKKEESSKITNIDIDWYSSPIYQSKTIITEGASDEKWIFGNITDEWSPVLKLPDDKWGCDSCDRNYKGFFNLENDDLENYNFYLDVESDDGIWIFVNTIFIGHWGGSLHEEGTVNCESNITEKVGPINISDRLMKGENVLDIHVSDFMYYEGFFASLIRKIKR